MQPQRIGPRGTHVNVNMARSGVIRVRMIVRRARMGMMVRECLMPWAFLKTMY